MRRTRRFCGWRMRRSVGRSNSNPASSAALKSSPLVSVSQPLACAVWTVCPDSARASPFGVPWSKKMSTGGDGVGAEAQGYEVENGRHLLSRDVELLDDLVNAQILEVLDDGGHGFLSLLLPQQYRTANHASVAEAVVARLTRGEERSPPQPPRGRGTSSSLTRAWVPFTLAEQHVGEFRER